MKTVFGPVPSRRLGQSLGIDPIPLKTCNWNCVYCQLGRTRPLTPERHEYIPRRQILADVDEALAAHRPGEIDWVTFVGSGEPTLHSGLGLLIREVKARSDLPVAVITNGALLSDPQVRGELLAADAVLPSLDAGDPILFRKVNRPWPTLKFDTHAQGLARFRESYTGHLWVEVMLVSGLNDTEPALTGIAAALHHIQPDRVHLTLPERPPAETWVRPPDEAGLQRALDILGEIAQVAAPPRANFCLSGEQDVIQAVIGVITRHPMRERDLRRALQDWKPIQVENALSTLALSGQAQVIERNGERFWCVAGAYYPEQQHLN
jgi:wyosine [tRNA(Phe)-imidazoG37] synthetase (radical SAM superfamily)